MSYRNRQRRRYERAAKRFNKASKKFAEAFFTDSPFQARLRQWLDEEQVVATGYMWSGMSNEKENR